MRTCCAHYPGGSERVHVSIASPFHTAFPKLWAGRHPHCPFRGLLRLHSRYGPHACSTAQGGLCHGASTEPVTRPRRPSATSSIDNSLGGTLLHRCFAPSRRTRGSRHAGGPRPARGNCKLAGRQYLRLRTSSPGAACYPQREPGKSSSMSAPPLAAGGIAAGARNSGQGHFRTKADQARYLVRTGALIQQRTSAISRRASQRPPNARPQSRVLRSW